MDAELVFMDLNGKEIDRVKTQSEKGFSFSPRKVIQGVLDNVARALEQGMRDSSKLAAYAASRGKGPSIAAAGLWPTFSPICFKKIADAEPA